MKATDVLSWGLIAMGFGLAAFFYADLPDPMPIHFRADGSPDRYAALPWGAVIVPLITVAVYALMRILPVISPKEFSMERFSRAYESVVIAVLAFMVLVQFVLLRTAVEPAFNVVPWIGVLIGGLLLVIANYMTKTQPNFFFGIRTPWTLANEEVWFKTHRQAAYLFALAGLVLIVTAPFGTAIYLSVGFIIAAALWLVLYSYLIYQRLTKKPT